jgi:hypothetical protein
LEFGFWKNNPDAWPVETLTLGTQSYTKQELIEILNMPVGRGRGADASLILARQLIAAKLNIASGSDPAPTVETISQAEASLAVYPAKLPYGVRPFTVEGREMTSLASALGDYNSGSLTPNCIPPLSANKPGFSREQILISPEYAIGSERYTLDLFTRLTEPPVTVSEFLRVVRKSPVVLGRSDLSPFS